MEEAVATFFSGSVPLGQSSTPFPAVAPQLYITGQKTHSEEVITKNGLQKTIHMVVKNSPFHIVLGLANSPLDFNRIAFDSSLVYDCDGFKEVDFVKAKPLEFKATPNDQGNSLDCEIRIKVLSSHHEDQLFRVKIQGYHPISKEEIPGLTLYSFPIKVISKPEQLKKRAPSKKRSLTDMIVDTITRIEKKQQEQQSLIEKMLQNQAVASANLQQQQAIGFQNFAMEISKKQRTEEVAFWDAITAPDGQTIQKDKEEGKKAEQQTPEFEDAFSNLIKSYNAMKAEEKPETIRKVIRNSSTRDTERLSEMLDLFWTEGLLKERSFGTRQPGTTSTQSGNGHTGEGCSCQECPHKVELERIDEFYKEFLSSGVSFPGFQ